MSDTIITETHENWVQITLNRPERLNAFNDEMHLALRESLQNAQADANCRAILLTGSGRGFCAGQDLGDRDPNKMTEPPNLGETLSKFYNPNVSLIRNMPKPVICAVNGVAAGAGANIAFGCDITFAAESAKFIQSFAKIGLVPDAGGTWLLPRLIGEQRAKAIALTAQPISAKQAEEWGMIWQATADDALLATAQAFTKQLASGPTVGFALTKKAMHQAATNSFEQQAELEAASQQQAGRSQDYAEGVSAFLEKRPANFKGV